MTNRTSSPAVLKELAAHMENGHPSFKVLSGTPAHREDLYNYIVAVPMAVMRSGFSGWLSKRLISAWGTPTKFGDDLFRTANRIEGVELSLDNDYPHVVQVFVDQKVLEDYEPPAGFYCTSRGLPAVVCSAIEETILRNQSLGQRFAEWLRRLF